MNNITINKLMEDHAKNMRKEIQILDNKKLILENKLKEYYDMIKKQQRFNE